MAMAQTAFRARSALNRHHTMAARRPQRAEMPLFQAFLRPSCTKVTNGLCIKEATTIDPACGSGNFLTETYISIRRLENEVISLLNEGQIVMDFGNPIKVSIWQFYGIEINDFAVTVAKTSLWIAESQMMKETEDVKEYRLASPKEATRKKAETPMLFDEVRECATDYVAIPKVSSENRRYIPIEYQKAQVIPGDSIFMMTDSTLYHFGILTSNVHNAWMRAVCGRLEMRYRYSNTVVYNNFPWPTPTDAQKAQIERKAQGILDARALYPDASLADLYDETTMPPELRAAHQANDRAVMQAYGFSVRDMTESSCVAALMRMYQELTEQENRK